MPKQSEKITGYIPKEIKEKFDKWCEENNIRSESQGVWLAFEWFFSGKKPLYLIEEEAVDLYAEYQQIKEDIEELKEANRALVELLQSAGIKHLSPLLKKSEEPPSEPVELELSEAEKQNGLTKTQLCRRLGFSTNQINTHAEKLGLSPEEYLYQIANCGAGEGDRPRFYFGRSPAKKG